MDDRITQQAIAELGSISHAMEQIKHAFCDSAYEMSRPHILLRPKIYLDGNKWCCLYGNNIQDGIAGFGDSPDKAMSDFDKSFYLNIKE